MSPDTPIVETTDLHRSYGHGRRFVNAVHGVSFQVDRGSIFGLIGPDGAGKTSIIQMLAGVLKPTRGKASVLGFDVKADPESIKRRIGYMPQGLGANLYDSLTVRENIEFFRDLRQLPNQRYQENRAELLRMTRLTPFLDRRALHLSGGMRQKLALVCTLIHLPDVLLLDEPTTGVDPISRQDFWQIIGGIVDKRQATVLLSTSYMDEAERCNRIALLHSGTIVAQGSPESLRSHARDHYAVFPAHDSDKSLRLVRDLPGVKSADAFGEQIRIRFSGDLGETESQISAIGIPSDSISVQSPQLEDVFLELLSGDTSRRQSIRFKLSDGFSEKIAIQVEHATRHFDGFTAVDDVNLQVECGEVFGLLGPNGAGKTTLIKMMCGLLGLTSGNIHIAGIDVETARSTASQRIGYMSQRFSLYRDLSVKQNLRLYSDLYDVDAGVYSSLVTLLGLDPYEHRLVRDLPSGLHQRVSLLCAVLHQPSVVFLDEPTSGVDPQARRIFWDLIHSLSRENKITVVVSTHYMDEAVHCDQLGLMDQGRLIAMGRPSDLTRISEQRTGSVLAIQAPDLRRTHEVILPRFQDALFYGDTIRMRSRNPEFDISILRNLFSDAGLREVRVAPVPPSMDETFIDFIRLSEAQHV
jgi:ABC-2 type transport system ATP-binding protein